MSTPVWSNCAERWESPDIEGVLTPLRGLL